MAESRTTYIIAKTRANNFRSMKDDWRKGNEHKMRCSKIVTTNYLLTIQLFVVSALIG